MSTIRIKRRLTGGGAGAPASLAAAELAFNEQTSILYYGQGDSAGTATSVIAIAGPGSFAPLNSPALTGAPASTTAAVDTNTTQIATTAFVLAQASAVLPVVNGTATIGTATRFARSDHIHPTDTSRAALNAPTFTGVPAAPTAAVDTNTTQLATTAFVVAQAASAATTALGTSTVGTSLRYARGDHVHAMPTHSQVGLPTADVAWGSFKITGLADPVSAQDAATKNYVDNTVQGLDPKASVRVATTAAGTLASSFANASVVDGITLATNDRILIKDQAAPAENGIYTVNAAGAPTRAVDANAWAELPGAYVFVEVGTANAEMGFLCTSDAGGTLGTTAITFQQFNGAGQVTAGTGLSKTGNTLSLAMASAGTLGGIRVGSGLSIDGSGILSSAGATNLGIGTVTTTTVPVTSSTGTTATLPAATTSLAGVMTSADKTKLDGIATNANNYSLPIAAAGSLGGIKVGSGLAIDGSGILSNTVSGSAPQIISINTTALAGNTYVMTAALTLTLPATPTAGQNVQFENMSGANCTVARNGEKIMGLLEDLTLDVNNTTAKLIYKDATTGWIVAAVTGATNVNTTAWTSLTGNPTTTLVTNLNADLLDGQEGSYYSPAVGSASIVTTGTIATGTWNATAIADGKIASALTGKTYNGLTVSTVTANTIVLTNGTTTFTVNTSGTIGSAAYTASSAYATSAQGTLATNALPASSFSDAGVTGKLITGYVSGAGTVAATDTILQAINKLNGNDALKLPSSSFTDAGVTGKLLTGYVSGAGAVAATDTILQAINKLNGNDALRETASNKNATGGYAGLSGYNIILKNNANTFSNLFASTSTAARTWTMPDASGTIALTSDIPSAATNLANGSAGTIPYQSAANTTAMLAAGTSGYFLKANGAAPPSWALLGLTDMPDAWVKKSVRCASTANVVIATGTLLVIDGITTIAGDRVLLKDQSAPAENGIYVAAAGAWARAADADTISEVAGLHVNVDSGTVNGGLTFDCDLKTTDTLGTTAAPFYRMVDTGYTIPATQGGTGQTVYAVGDLLYASTTTAVSKLADVATGNALISGGVGVAPSYGKIGLSTHVSGSLPQANGGLNTDTSGFADGSFLKKSGTGFVAATLGTDYLSSGSTIDGGTF